MNKLLEKFSNFLNSTELTVCGYCGLEYIRKEKFRYSCPGCEALRSRQLRREMREVLDKDRTTEEFKRACGATVSAADS